MTKLAKNTVSMTKTEANTILEQMLLSRALEEKAVELYGVGFIGGFLHVANGQEAVAIGFQSILHAGDTVVTAYRCHSHALATGMEAKVILAELLGRRGGCSKGKGGSMHIFAPDKGFMGGHGIVGAQVPLGAGFAFYHHYNKTGGVALAYMGDGAADQGQVFEAMNMAALWKLPVVFIVENNHYSMGTSTARHSADTDYTKRAFPFSIPSEKVDGMDVHAVRDAGLRATAHCREGKGPYFLEVVTYRYRGHSMSDPAKYRSKEEVQEMREKNDPINSFKAYVLKEKLLSSDDIALLIKHVATVITEAEAFAMASPEPDVSELYTDIVA